MQLHAWATSLALGVSAWSATVARAAPLTIYNQCNVSIGLYNNTYTETIAPGCSTTRTLGDGFSGMFRNGWNPQATRTLKLKQFGWGIAACDTWVRLQDLSATVWTLGAVFWAMGTTHATPLTVYNLCDESIDLYDNSATETIAAGGSTTRTLAEGFSGMFRSGVDAQATSRINMQPRPAPLVLLLATLVAVGDATAIHFINLCGDSMKLYGGNAETTVKDGTSTTYDLADDDNAAYRYGVSYQATLAGSRTCLEDCKAVTGGVGFNAAMQIVPSTGGGLDSSDTCRVLSCLEDGCDDAYQYPDEADRTHSCSEGVEFEVIFCPNNDSSSTDGSASDFWVDLGSSSNSEASGNGSGDSSNGSGGSASEAEGRASEAEAEVDGSTPASASQSTSSGSSGDGQTTSNVSSGISSATSPAIYVASALVGSVVVIGATIFVIQHRRAFAERWEAWRRRARRSSETFFFVRAKDEAAS
ncbi:hypothetical protein BBJ28_00004347 [Nothophytophthora sp. Chile5]|nr:hypothetical protein BBJ28_00004347 [Nothophytophthora sp. Chile5]